MWSLPALSTLNTLAGKVGNREALKLFTSPLKVDSDKANALLAEDTADEGVIVVCPSCGPACPVEAIKRQAS